MFFTFKETNFCREKDASYEKIQKLATSGKKRKYYIGVHSNTQMLLKNELFTIVSLFYKLA